ncbi:MAG: metallophosphoesterase family protein [Saprospiraceae bacterium]|nr:metallophosphoesterase family protein [Saprospiraceae bacterium]
MKLVQITDLHVASEGEFTHGVDVRQNFLDIIQAVKSFAPEHLIITGDLAFDTANEEVYRWMKSHLDALGIPYSVIAGNHDTSSILAKVFQLEHHFADGDLYYKLQLGDRSLLLLETSMGTVSAAQQAWLTKELSAIDGPALVFMHHPPVVGGVAYMDTNYPLRNMGEVQAILHAHPHPVYIFCGHYHVEKMICSRNIVVHITPTTYFQMKWQQPVFELDNLKIALREIVLRDDGTVESTVVYYEGNKK